MWEGGETEAKRRRNEGDVEAQLEKKASQLWRDGIPAAISVDNDEGTQITHESTGTSTTGPETEDDDVDMHLLWEQLRGEPKQDVVEVREQVAVADSPVDGGWMTPMPGSRYPSPVREFVAGSEVPVVMTTEPPQPERLTFAERNLGMWKEFESDLRHARENILKYVEYKDYNVEFHNMLPMERSIGSAILSGGMSVSVGLLKAVLFYRKLLLEHHDQAERHGESLEFDETSRMFIMDRLGKIEKCAWECTRRKALAEPMKRQMRWPRSVDDIGSRADFKAMREVIMGRIMYVGGPETFGDAELSSDNSDSSCADSELTSMPDVSSRNAGKSSAIKAARTRHERNAYIKIARNHRLCIVVLPEGLRNTVIKKVLEGRRAIEDRGYTASDAWEDVEGITGKLRGNLDMRRLLKKLMFSSKLLN